MNFKNHLRRKTIIKRFTHIHGRFQDNRESWY